MFRRKDEVELGIKVGFRRSRTSSVCVCAGLLCATRGYSQTGT